MASLKHPLLFILGQKQEKSLFSSQVQAPFGCFFVIEGYRRNRINFDCDWSRVYPAWPNFCKRKRYHYYILREDAIRRESCRGTENRLHQTINCCLFYSMFNCLKHFGIGRKYLKAYMYLCTDITFIYLTLSLFFIAPLGQSERLLSG